MSDGVLAPKKAYTLPDIWNFFSHSYGDGVAGSLDQRGRIDSYVRQALDVEYTNWRKYSISASRLTVEGAAQGGWATLWRVTSYGKWAASGTRAAPYAPEGGAMVMLHGINDLGTLGGATTQILAAYQQALRSCISRWRASTIWETTASNTAFGGVWTTETTKFDQASNGEWRYHATTGGTVTLTLPADYNGEPIAICLIGRPGVNGGIVTWSGTAGITGTTSTDNIMPSATLSNVPVIKRITTLTSANAGQTIIGTVTQNSGLVYYDCWWIESKAPPPVIVCDVPRLTASGYSTKYAGWTAQTASLDGDVQALNTSIASVVAEFDAMVQIAGIDAKLNKTASYFSDGLHPNEQGAALCADAIVDAINRCVVNGSYGVTGQMNTLGNKAAPMRYPVRASTWYGPTGLVKGTAATPVAGQLTAYPMVITEGTTRWSNWAMEVVGGTSITVGVTCRIAIFADYNLSGYPDTLIQEITISGVLSTSTTTGVKTVNAGGFIWYPDPGLYWLAIKIETAGTGTGITLGVVTGQSPIMPNSSSTGSMNSAISAVGWQLTGQATGAFVSTFPTGGALTAAGPAVTMFRT
jgi:hypothetical protein